MAVFSMTLKIDFFREINLTLFVLLQTIQLSFETFFNESLRSRQKQVSC